MATMNRALDLFPHKLAQTEESRCPKQSACPGFQKCVTDLMGNRLAYPMDAPSLYSQRIYDKQIAERACFENNPSVINSWRLQ